MKDNLIRFIARDAEFRGTVGFITNTADLILKQHSLSPSMGEYLGDAALAALLLAQNIKQGSFSLRLDSTGTIGLLAADATPDGFVRGMISKANIEDEEQCKKLNLPMIGLGNLYVTKRMSLGAPSYQGVVELAHHRIAPIIAQYLLQSEQINSSIGLATIFDANIVSKCAGFAVEALPKLTNEDLEKLENNIKKIGDFKRFLLTISEPKEILDTLLDGFAYDIVRETPVTFFCPCSEEKVISSIKAAGTDEVLVIKNEGKSLEVFCDTCRKQYIISPDLL